MNKHVPSFLLAAAVLLAAMPMPAAPQAGPAAVPAPVPAVPSPLQKALFERLQVLEAWELTKGSLDVLVGIVDTGFDHYHPLLKDRLRPGFYAAGAFHAELNGTNGHGTAIASLIGAGGGTAGEMTGLAPGCAMISASLGMIDHLIIRRQQEWARKKPGAAIDGFLKELAASPEMTRFRRDWMTHISTATADSIRYLVDRGVRVINISALMLHSLMKEDADWNRLQDGFRYAAGKGVLIVIGAGNSAREVDDYPGDEAATLVVGATRLDDSRWEQEDKIMGRTIKQGSMFGKRLSVMAPAESIAVCVPHEGRFYTSDDGPMGPESGEFKKRVEVWPMGATSCATPVVTALAALVFSLRPDLDGPAVADLIKRGCDDIGEKGYDIYSGHGRVNFLRTLELARRSEVRSRVNGALPDRVFDCRGAMFENGHGDADQLWPAPAGPLGILLADEHKGCRPERAVTGYPLRRQTR